MDAIHSEENSFVEEITFNSVNIISFASDSSGSMYPYKDKMVECLEYFRSELIKAKDLSKVLLSRADFSSEIFIDRYDDVDYFNTTFVPGGCTTMYDAIVECSEDMLTQQKHFNSKGVNTKCIFIMFSDGFENGSYSKIEDARNVISNMNNKGIVTIFISFGSEAKVEAENIGFYNILEVNKSTEDLESVFVNLSKSLIKNLKQTTIDNGAFFT